MTHRVVQLTLEVMTLDFYDHKMSKPSLLSVRLDFEIQLTTFNESKVLETYAKLQMYEFLTTSSHLLIYKLFLRDILERFIAPFDTFWVQIIRSTVCL